jgi:signal transduction histidine kinase
MPAKRILYFFILSVLCAVGGVLFDQSRKHKSRQLERIETNLSALEAEITSEAQSILNDKVDDSNWSSLRNSFFLMDSTEVLAWSNNQFFPDIRRIHESPDRFELSRTNSGDYLFRSWPVAGTRKLISVIPLQRTYPIVNRYLSPIWNAEIFSDSRGLIFESTSTEGEAINLHGQLVFRINLESIHAESGVWSFILATTSILFFIAVIYGLTHKFYRDRKHEWAFITLAGTFVLLRLVMIAIDYPSAWITSRVFDPQFFASASYNASIGDLFLNSLGILILCGYVFFTYHHWNCVRYILNISGQSARFIVGCLLITASFFSFLYPFLFVETIFHNSSIQLDISETAKFDWLRVLSWLSILAGVISAFFFVHVFINLVRSFFSSAFRYLSGLIISAIIFGLYFMMASHDYAITLPVAALYFSILYFTNLTASLRKLESITFIYFFVVLASFGIQHALSVKYFSEELRAESQIKFASNYLIGRDVMGEYLLNEAIKRIRQDAFIQGRISNPFLTKSAIRQKIKQVYLNSYFDRYEAKIHLYNSAGEPVDNSSSESLSAFTNRYKSSSTFTDYEGLYFVPPSDMNANKRYLALIPVTRADQPVGYVGIDLSLKRIIPQNVYPELLVDRRFAEFFENTNRSYSFINEGKILSSFGTYNYERDFDFNYLKEEDFYNAGIVKNGYFHTGVENSDGQVVVITSAAYPLFYVLTNFSFFFVSGVLLLVMAMLLYGVMSFLKGAKMNYAARIQLYIYLAFSLPLFVATITTLNRVSKSAENELQQTFEANARNLGEGILSYVADYSSDSLSREDFENLLIGQAKVANVDITFYNPLGKYVASSQPLIVENQIMSPLMNRRVYEKISKEHVSSMIEDEQVGSLQFNNCYVTIKSPESGVVLGTLSVPFFNSARSLETTQVNVLSNFLTVFTVIFILFSVVSFYIVNSLTFPLRFITRILSQTTLSGVNKPLEWKSRDEIGMMVNEYNKMLHNLEQSKIELARSQKESAWREIAKQVAHEIKNPLTPMKLTLQQMEIQLKNKMLDDEKARASITALLAQVDILNEIASSFSAFARMPAPILERIDLAAILKKATQLYQDYEGGVVTYTSPIATAWVLGDEQLFNRIFSNMILNGLQSGGDDKVTVQVELMNVGDHYHVIIKDNGKGIDPEIINKVFIPYFSTKQSGSGLGLAISRQGIEQSGGEIWFETKAHVGTTFTISLPRIQ